MRVLVTGAAGFIGSNVASLLIAKGHQVVGIDCYLPNLYPAEEKMEKIRRLRSHENFTFVELDMRRDDIRPHLLGVDVVINEAAMPGLGPSWTDYPTYQDCNVTAVQRLLDSIRVNPNVHLVHISTSSVYGRNAVTDESGSTRPVSPYGVTKLAAEQLVSAYRSEFSLKTSILRYFSVYGPGQRPDMAFAKFCRLLMQGEPIPITGDGTHSRSITYVSDVAQATLLASEAQLDGTVMNISGNWEIGLLDAVKILADQIGVTPRFEFVKPRLGDQNRTAGDSKLARSLIGWEPEIDPESGLRMQAQEAMMSNMPNPL